MPRHENEHPAMEGDDDLVPSREDAIDHDPRSLGGWHEQPRRNRLARIGVKLATIVHPPDVRLDEAR